MVDRKGGEKMPLIETPKEFLTEKIWKTGFRGIFVGGCIERKEGSSFRRKAHAHTSKEDPYFGYICVRSAKRLYKKDGRPSRLLIHEIAHFFTPKEYHSKRFHKKRLELQREIERSGRRQGDV
jgi:hypothetical protein